MAWEKVAEEKIGMFVGAIWRHDQEPGYAVTVRHVLEPERCPESTEHGNKAEAREFMRCLMRCRNREALH